MEPLTLEERKQISLEILRKIDAVCRKHQIPYYMAYGSLLGAVRHQGFIPWDDDIDIWVPVTVYSKFVKAMEKFTSYEILSWRKPESGWMDSFVKISDSRTSVQRADGRDSVRRGIAIDVFPLMYYGDETWTKQILAYNLDVQRLITYQYDLFPPSKVRPALKAYCKMQQLLGHDVYERNCRIWSLAKKNQSGEFCGCPVSIYKTKDRFRSECFAETEEVTFEGYHFLAPKLYKEVLTNLYGDFMQLPPVEKRISNHDVVVYWNDSN